MNKIDLIVPCHFGVEAVLRREIDDLGYDVTEVNDGRVTFVGDGEAVCRANICLRTGERVLIRIASFPAETFEELFQGTKAVAWDEYIPVDGRFHVTKAASVKSKLYSPSDIQSIVKKAIVEQLKERYHVEWFREDGALFPLRVFIMKDMVTIALDTSGESLHKRGYRKLAAKAPIAENLAAALIMLTPWKKERILIDPFCGSGTFPIEAAMIAAGIAPGLRRSFLAESWQHLIASKEWQEIRSEAEEEINHDIEVDIQGYDLDDSIVTAARANARLAGVGDMIHFQQRNVSELSHAKKYGFIITNPPYGERMDDDLQYIYKMLGERFQALDAWSLYMISAYQDAERDIGILATKNRKIYNGMIKTYFLQFAGSKPRRTK
ncbi:MAG: class I SAM-dependent RNA methyltransferase [Lachnospiraceae bacterium]|jgi:putative N6-adenine-specific DNA methylase|nr:class I SAM-dependent RNA methyltransferase [Lachnospiraceae bacterium]